MRKHHVAVIVLALQRAKKSVLAKLALVDIARSYAVSHSTISRLQAH